MFGVDHRRVVQIAAYWSGDDSGPEMGSGYRVSASWVLTARHVLHEAAVDRIAVQSHTGEWTSGVTSWLDLGDDVALLEIEPIADGAELAVPKLSLVVDPPTYGHLDRSPNEMTAVAIGYPLSALKRTEADLTKPTQPFRDTIQTRGRIESMSSLRQGTFAIDEFDTVDPALAPSRPWTGEQPAPQSKWQGMSGAALWVNDVLVGVITAVESDRSPQRLTATRIDHVLRRLARDDPALSHSARTALGLLPGEALADAAFDADYVLDPEEFRALRSILAEALGVPSLPRIFREATDYSADPPADAEDVLANIGELRRLVSATPLFRFLVRFAAETSDEDASERLEAWIERTARRWRVDPDELRSERERARPTVLLVQLEPAEVGTGWQVTAWLYTGRSAGQVAAPDDQWDREDLGIWLGTELHTLLGEFDPHADSSPLSVEFSVDVDSLEDDLEWVPVTIGEHIYPLGAAFPVLMRSLDRLRQGAWIESWADKWRRLRTTGHIYDADIIHWVDRPGPLRSELNQVAAALAYSGQRSDWLATLNAVLQSGTPVAVWHRVPCRTMGRRAALENILGNIGLSELPRRVLRQRVAAARSSNGDHIGRNLVLLWDDADRIPPTPEYQAPTWEGAEP